MTLLEIIQIIIGFIGLTAIAIPLSNSKSNINYKSIFIAILFQIALAFALIKIPFIVNIFSYFSTGVEKLQEATNAGTQFVFGYLAMGEGEELIFAFKILPLIIVISCLTALFWFWKILPILIRSISKVFEKLFNIGGPIGL